MHSDNTTETQAPGAAGSGGPLAHAFSGSFLIQIALLLVTGVIAYGNSLYGPFHFDDLGITDKTYLWPRAFSSGPRQLVDLTFVLNHLVNGDNVLGYHLINIAVHLTTTIVLYGLVHSALTALTVSFPRPADSKTSAAHFMLRFLPFAAALLFVCHPIQTQAVSYIVQRYTSMAALFYFASVTAFISARAAALQKQTMVRIWGLAILSILLGAAAMRCKEIAYTLPLMLVVVEISLFRGRLLKNRAFIAGMAALLIVLPLARIAQHGISGLDDLLFKIQHSTKEELTYSRGDYLVTQFRVVASYLRLLILPINQNLDYDIPLQKTFLTLPVLASAALHLSVLATSVVLFFRSRRHLLNGNEARGVCLRLISFGIIWFYLALMIESSIIPILDVMFEHRLYLPSGGAFLAMAAFAAFLADSRHSFQKAAWITLAIVCCLLTVATIQRNRIWNNDLLLWEDTARKSPNKPRVLSNLAAAYLRNQMPEKALAPLIRTIEMAPGMADPLNYLGIVLDSLGKYTGRYDNGRRYILGSRTVDMRYYNAWFANANNNLGLVYEYLGNPEMAARHFETAVSMSPDFDLAWYNLFLTAHHIRNRMLKMAAYDKLKTINPGLAVKALQQTGSDF